MNNKDLSLGIAILFSFLILFPSMSFADLVTAYTFESGTELKDVAVMLEVAQSSVRSG